MVDTDLCVLSAYCVKAAPGHFHIEPGAKTVSSTFDVTSDPAAIELVYEAEAVCPTGALTVEPV